VLSLDKNREKELDYGIRTLRIYPDDPQTISTLFEAVGMTVLPVVETEFAWIITAERR